MDGWLAAGGSLSVGELIDKHGDALVADFRRYYGLDLADVIDGRGGLTPRKALALIVHLPAASAFAASARGGHQYRGWTEDRYLAVAQINAIREQTWVLAAINSKRPPKRPEPLPTPDDGDKRKKNKPGGFEVMLERARAAQQQRGN